VYFPSSAQIRSLFGARLYSFGATPWTGNSTKSGLSPEIGVINGDMNGNKFLVIPIALAYEKDFVASDSSSNGVIIRRGGGGLGSSLVPYLRVSAGVSYFDYSITTAAGNYYSTKRLGSNAGLEAGLKVSTSAKLFVKYDLFSTEQHFSFNGVQVGVVVSLARL
jgi:hypothetical protein